MAEPNPAACLVCLQFKRPVVERILLCAGDFSRKFNRLLQRELAQQDAEDPFRIIVPDFSSLAQALHEQDEFTAPMGPAVRERLLDCANRTGGAL